MGSQPANRNVLLGVTGGIAAYKAVDLASKLTASGHTVRTIMTAHACELVKPKSFEAVTGRAVSTSLWHGPDEFQIGHVSLADWADMVVVAPGTANILAKMAHGICDDLLSTTLCACWPKPVVIAPAMNTKMWSHPAVQCNVETLRERGLVLVGPEMGRLACGNEGIGRMSEPATIIEAIEEAIA